MTEKYQSVNGAWPETVPSITAQEAVSAAKRLYRFTLKRSFRGKVRLTSGNRYTRISSGVMIVNPDRGWQSLVHLLSHHCHRRLWPKHRPHDGRGTHAAIEREMINHVIASGWLDGVLRRPEKENPDPREVRQARVLARIVAWESKLRRAQNALAKLNRQRAYYLSVVHRVMLTPPIAGASLADCTYTTNKRRRHHASQETPSGP